MSVTHQVGVNDRGDIGYVTCQDEWAPRLIPWHGYIVTAEGDLIDLPTTLYRSWAEQAVSDRLQEDT